MSLMGCQWGLRKVAVWQLVGHRGWWLLVVLKLGHGGTRRRKTKKGRKFLKIIFEFKKTCFLSAVMCTECDSVLPVINGMITKGSIWPISQILGVYNFTLEG